MKDNFQRITNTKLNLQAIKVQFNARNIKVYYLIIENFYLFAVPIVLKAKIEFVL